jgi:hypothetical protein
MMEKQMNKTARLAIAGVAVAAFATLGVGTAAYAHHAFAAEFDSEAPVLLKGTVTVVEWVNPHTWIHMHVPDTDAKGKEKKGTTWEWMVEGGTPNTLLRTGITKTSLKPGTQVVVRGYQSKDALCDVSVKTKKKTCKANGRHGRSARWFGRFGRRPVQGLRIAGLIVRPSPR